MPYFFIFKLHKIILGVAISVVKCHNKERERGRDRNREVGEEEGGEKIHLLANMLPLHLSTSGGRGNISSLLLSH